MHPQSREMRSTKKNEKTSGKIWKIKEKVLTFAPATRQSEKGSSLKDLHIQRVVQVLKKTYRQKILKL